MADEITGPVPKLVVFDCDMCLWCVSPEMFQLNSAPSGWNESTNTVIAGRGFVKIFPGAVLALRELHSHDKFQETQVAVASATSHKSYAMECLRCFEVSPGVKVDHILSYREIYPSHKGQHFNRLHELSGVPYNQMLFFDDCIWGDNCRDVERACPGVTTVKTPRGLTQELWKE
ncbi:unnamed protein product, partial [Discosporangium mesarthrocarpum]